MFNTPQQQLETARELNKKFDWGFTNKHFEAINTIPESPEDNLTTLLLVPYFGTLQKTFDKLWESSEYQFKDLHTEHSTWRNSSLKAVKLYQGKHPKKQLKWMAINLGDHKGLSPDEARGNTKDNTKLAGVEVLAAATMHPEWVNAMNGSQIPYPNLSALNSKLGTDWSSVPYLRRWDGVRRLGLHAGFAGHATDWASPSVRDLAIATRSLGTQTTELEPSKLDTSDLKNTPDTQFDSDLILRHNIRQSLKHAPDLSTERKTSILKDELDILREVKS